jgi:hypothetical protein
MIITWKYKVFERLNTNGPTARVHKQDIRGFKRSLSRGGPEPKLTIVFAFLFGGTGGGWRVVVKRGRSLRHDGGHDEDLRRRMRRMRSLAW